MNWETIIKKKERGHKRERIAELFLVLITFVIILFLTSYHVIFSPGIPILAEQIEVFNSSEFLKIFVYTWNEKINEINLGDTSKFYLYVIIYIFSLYLGFETTIKLFLVLPIPLSFLSMYVYLRIHYNHYMSESMKKFSHRSLIIFTLLVFSLLYSLNPWIVNRSRNIILRYQYSLLPLMILLFDRFMEEKSFKSAFVYGYLFSLIFSLTESYRFFVISLPLFLFILFSHIFDTNRINKNSFMGKNGIGLLLKKILFLIVITFLFVSPFYIPFLIYFISGSNSGIISNFVINKESLINVLSLNFIYSSLIFNTPYPPNDYSPYLYLLVTIISMASIIYINQIENKRLYIVVVASFIFYVILSTNSMGLEIVYVNFIFIGRLLRQPYHNARPLPFLISIMGTYTYVEFVRTNFKKRKIKFVAMTLLLIIIGASSSWPLLTGDLNGYWRPSEIPEDYLEVYNILNQNSSYRLSNILVFPHFSTYKSTWSEAYSYYSSKPPMGIFDTLFQPLSSFISNDLFFEYYSPISPYPFNIPIKGYGGNHWDRVYRGVGIRFLLLHNDTEYPSHLSYLTEKINEMIDLLKRTEKIKLLYEGRNLALFDLNNNGGIISIKDGIYITNGIYIHGTLSDLSSAYSNNYALIYPDFDSFKQNIFYLNISEIIISNGDFLDLILPIAPNVFTIYFQKSSIEDDTSGWLIDSGYYSLLSILERFGIYNWQWDFLHGPDQSFVYSYYSNSTRGEIPSLIAKFKVNEENRYQIYVRLLKSKLGGQMRFLLDNMEISKIATVDNVNRFMWIKIGTFNLGPGEHKIKILNDRGLNIINSIKILKYDDFNTSASNVISMLKQKRIIYVFEPEFDMYYNKENILINKEFSNGRAISLQDGEFIWRTFDVFKPGYYRAIIRFKGNVTLNINNVQQRFVSDKLTISVSKAIFLNSSLGTIRVIANNDSLVDTIIIYSINNETIKDINGLFKVKLNYKIDIIKENPTLWKIRVTLENPSIISFAQKFNNFWICKITYNNSYSEKLYPIKLYGIINGFFIKDKGIFKIEIRFYLQDIFNLNLILAFVSFLIGDIYLLWILDIRKLFLKILNYIKRICVI